MKRTLLTVAVLTVAASSFSQVTKPMGLSVRGGIVFPTSGYGRDLGAQWFGAGAEFRLSDLRFGQMQSGYSGAMTLSADYYSKGEASAVPVMLNYMASQNEFFYSAGVGLVLTRDKENGNNRNKTNFGYQLGLGYNFQQGATPVFVEAKYFGNSNSRLNAFGVYLGIRL